MARTKAPPSKPRKLAAAKKNQAGYKETVAKSDIYTFLRRTEIQKIIKKKEITIAGKDGAEYTKSIIGLKPLPEMTPERRAKGIPQIARNRTRPSPKRWILPKEGIGITTTCRLPDEKYKELSGRF